MSDRGKILLVEDDMQVQINNLEILKLSGYCVVLAMNLAEARAEIKKQKPDAVVLDISLPDGDGVDFLKELRHTLNIPVLMLTASQAASRAAASFDAGGDDYLRKPYDLKEFRARVDALMRRAARVPEIITKDRLSLDVTAGLAMLDGVDLMLTQKEISLLLVFVQNEERFISMERIYEKIWKAPMVDSQAIRQTVSRLNKKISGSGYLIAWSRGEGYSFERE